MPGFWNTKKDVDRSLVHQISDALQLRKTRVASQIAGTRVLTLPKIRHHGPRRRTKPQWPSPSEPVYVPVALKKARQASRRCLTITERSVKPRVPNDPKKVRQASRSCPTSPQKACQASRAYSRHQSDTTHATRIVPVACAVA
jgi:hypothetical protein